MLLGLRSIFRDYLARASVSLLVLVATAVPTFAQTSVIPEIGREIVVPSGFAFLAITLTVALALVRIRRLQAHDLEARKKISELEFLLNESETAQKAEAHLLLVWSGPDDMPQRLSGSMHGSVRMPDTRNALMNFEHWLEIDSATMVRDGLSELRGTGRAFNIGLKTITGELLEADGRAAGGMATLRFRPLSGERRQVTELAYDARKLSKQVERLSALLDVAPFPVWIRDSESKLQWVNQAYVKASDLNDIEAVMQQGFEIVKHAEIDVSKADKEQALIGRAQSILAGELRSFNIHEVPITEGKAGFAIDVTSLHAIEKELDRHVKAHASTLDKLTTALAIFGPDQRLKFFNRAYVELWNLDEAWLKTEPSDNEVMDRLRSARMIPEQVNYREWKAKQLSAYTAIDTQENYWYLPDGRSLQVTAERHPFGGVTYLYDNLTREYQLESQYNELFDVQQETLDNLAEAVALFAGDGKMKLANPAFAKFWKLDQDVLAGKPSIDELSAINTLSDDAKRGWQNIRFAVTGIETSAKTIEGQMQQDQMILRYRSAPLPDGNSLVTFTDISDNAKAEQALRDRAEALEAADRLKNSFLANVSYQIRTPLTSIVGFAETLEYGIAGVLTQKQGEYVQNIRTSSEELKTIIDAIIDLSTIDAGAMELKLQQADVLNLMQNAAERAAVMFERRKLSVEIEMGQDDIALTCDPNRVEQILGHLLSNAAGFSPDGGQIFMGARMLGSDVQVWVADKGRGIDPEFQSKAFERFQSKAAAGSRHRGPGLGLALVKSFTELHGGNVSLVSKPGAGTTVICTLPLEGPVKQGGIRDRRRSRAA